MHIVNYLNTQVRGWEKTKCFELGANAKFFRYNVLLGVDCVLHNDRRYEGQVLIDVAERIDESQNGYEPSKTVENFACLCAAFHSWKCLKYLMAFNLFGGGCCHDCYESFGLVYWGTIVAQALTPAVFRKGFLDRLFDAFWPSYGEEFPGPVEQILTLAEGVLWRQIGINPAVLSVLAELEEMEFFRADIPRFWPTDVSVARDSLVLTFGCRGGLGRDALGELRIPLGDVSAECLVAIVSRLVAQGGWRKEFCAVLVKHGARRCALYAYEKGCICRTASVDHAIAARDLRLLELALVRGNTRKVPRGRSDPSLRGPFPESSVPQPSASAAQGNSKRRGRTDPPSVAAAKPLTEKRLREILSVDLAELLEVALMCGAIRKIVEVEHSARMWGATRCLDLLRGVKK